MSGRASSTSVGGRTGSNRARCVSGRLGSGNSHKRKVRIQTPTVNTNYDASQLMKPQASDDNKENATENRRPTEIRSGRGSSRRVGGRNGSNRARCVSGRLGSGNKSHPTLQQQPPVPQAEAPSVLQPLLRPEEEEVAEEEEEEAMDDEEEAVIAQQQVVRGQ